MIFNFSNASSFGSRSNESIWFLEALIRDVPGLAESMN